MDALQKGDHGRQIGTLSTGGTMSTPTVRITAAELRPGDVIIEKHPTGGTFTRWPVEEVSTAVIPQTDPQEEARGQTEVIAVLTFPSLTSRPASFLATDKLTVERAS